LKYGFLVVILAPLVEKNGINLYYQVELVIIKITTIIELEEDEML